MNKYQRVLNKYTKYQKLIYKYLFPKEKHTFRWHRCQLRLIEKINKENDFKSIIKNKNSFLKSCKEEKLI